MIDDRLWQTIAAALPDYLEKQRWYADKARPLRSLELIDLAVVERAQSRILLALIGLAYQEGDERQYFVPMTITAKAATKYSTIAVHDSDGTRIHVNDAPADQDFRNFLVEAGLGLDLSGQHGDFEFEPWQIDGTPFTLDPHTQSNATALEQSNSSIAYGKEVMIKLYRRLESGQNIEVDMNRYLASERHLRAVPKLIGCVTYRGKVGTVPLALAQQHAGDHRDCWSALTSALANGSANTLDLVERLGTVTGEMHVALAAAPFASPMVPESITAADIAEWKRAFLHSAIETDRLIGDRSQKLSARSANAAHSYLARMHNWATHARDFDLLAGFYKTRVHGDYHLGQILLTNDDRLLIIDFEGEPQRSAQERAAKYSPLRDVAGMLRSLTYARGFVERQREERSEPDRSDWLARWEHDARARFLRAYRLVIDDAVVPIAPTENQAFDKAVAVMEIDKALYEIRYELHSRPDWAWLPLESLI